MRCLMESFYLKTFSQNKNDFQKLFLQADFFLKMEGMVRYRHGVPCMAFKLE